MTLHICEVTEKNWRSVAALNVAKDQQQFIESNAFSLAESLYEGNGTSVGLYDGETLVGLMQCMDGIGKNVKSVWLDRFMIDQRYQGKGYAKRFLRLLIQFLQNKFECKTIYLSLHPDNKPAMGLYESFGFRLNGDIDDEGPVVGVVMELLLDEHTSL
ncbi:GNAT family N-acetyltransferase [Bacillus cereus]